ncbi:MAG: NTP transferase domain-containing protein [Bacilli bacterium]|nr:NTP transferase domain-containing protein [Bacilli bacterium]
MESIILAGGKGKRMKGNTPKVLIEVEGIPIVKRVLNALSNEYINRTIIVVGDNFEDIQKELNGNITYAYQRIPLGTMDAYVQALPYVSKKCVIVAPADIPYLDKDIIKDIIEYYYHNNMRNLLIGMRVINPYGYGRVIVSNKRIKIVEEKDCTDEEKKQNIINTGIYIFNVEDVYPYLGQLQNKNNNQEYYLTDFINYLSENKLLGSLVFPENYHLKGANDLETLKILSYENDNENTFKKNY